MMQAVPLKGQEARIATLRVKLGIARSRAVHAPRKAERESQAGAAERYAAQLRELGETP